MNIDLGALRHNVEVARSFAPGSNIVAVLKANAYGHGAITVAKAIQSQVTMFAVSSIEEALQLRHAGLQKQILLLEGCFHASELAVAQDNDFAVVFHNLEQVAQLERESLNGQVATWLKLDTGMHRLGLDIADGLIAYRRLVASGKTAKQPILMTHMASADLLDKPYTKNQMLLFDEFRNRLGEAGANTSIGNSATVMAWPQAASDYIRPGIMLYGLSPFEQGVDLANQLKPVMTLESEVIAIRQVAVGECVGYGSTWQAQQPSVVATVAIGYGDGYPRNAKSGTPVLVKGNRAKLAGRVSMDMLSIDVTHIPGVKLGDKVTLWGEGLNVNEVASWADTIGYELVTRMPLRVPKHYYNG